MAMRERDPKGFMELLRAGTLEATLQTKGEEANAMLRQMPVNEPTGPTGLVIDLNAERMAEEVVMAAMLDFPQSEDPERAEPPDDLPDQKNTSKRSTMRPNIPARERPIRSRPPMARTRLSAAGTTSSRPVARTRPATDAAKIYPDLSPSPDAARKALPRDAGKGDLGDIPLAILLLRAQTLPGIGPTVFTKVTQHPTSETRPPPGCRFDGCQRPARVCTRSADTDPATSRALCQDSLHFQIL